VGKTDRHWLTRKPGNGWGISPDFSNRPYNLLKNNKKFYGMAIAEVIFDETYSQ
jgi:hypothetical protein